MRDEQKLMQQRSTYVRLFALGGGAVFVLWLAGGAIVYFVWPDNHGSVGDMFGAVNALFSGLAFLGVIVAIWMQNEELQLQRVEMTESRLAQQVSAIAQQKQERQMHKAAELAALGSLRQQLELGRLETIAEHLSYGRTRWISRRIQEVLAPDESRQEMSEATMVRRIDDFREKAAASLKSAARISIGDDNDIRIPSTEQICEIAAYVGDLALDSLTPVKYRTILNRLEFALPLSDTYYFEAGKSGQIPSQLIDVVSNLEEILRVPQ